MGAAPALRASLPVASDKLKRITIDNPRVQRLTADGGVAGTVPGTPFYRNDIDLTSVVFYEPDAGVMVSDDLELATGPCEEIAYYEIAVIGDGASAPTFDVHTELWTYDESDSCRRGVKIVNSDGDFANVPNDGETISVLGVTLPAGAQVPANNTVWLAATFTANDAGWIIGERAEVGFTQDLFAEGTTSPCLWWFGGDPYAGFYATLSCQTTGDPTGACCSGSDCSETTESACTAGGGTWQGAFTSCDPSPCLPGACCSGDAFTTCTETTESGCVGEDELFHPEVVCDGNTCQPAFPGYVNDFATGWWAGPDAGRIWADDLLFTPCNLAAYSIEVVGESGAPDFDVHLEIWSNNDRGTESDPLDDTPMTLIPGTEADFTGIPSDQVAHTLLAGPFPKIALSEKVWLVFTTSLPGRSGPFLGGEADPGLSQDRFAETVNPSDPGSWALFNFGGFNPEGCPGPAPCVPAGSFHITVWCQGEPPVGACCNDVAGTCVDGVRETRCDGRFAPNASCDTAPFDPPCGTSACCSEFACNNMLPPDCVAFGDALQTSVAIGYGRLCHEVDCPHLACLEATGDCSASHGGLGCDDPFCCGAVCSTDSQCCETGWDSVCASFAAQMCEQALKNDHCRDPEPLQGIGTFPFDTSLATTDGAPHEGCLDQLGEEAHILDDAWFCWTSPCNGTVSVSTCDGGATFDTKLAVYDGCGTCPPTDADLIACNDDACSTQHTLSTVVFNAAVGEEKLIRIGMFPGEQAGGPGDLIINCDVEACCLPDDACEELDALVCLQKGGDSNGPGSVCTGIAACHLPDQTCVNIDEHCCVNQGGTPKPGESCLGSEACCLPDDTCEEIDALVCLQKGGGSKGPGSVCMGVAACHFPDQTCVDIDQHCCLNQGGTPKPGESCLGSEACCLPDDTCEEIDALVCVQKGGDPKGTGTGCVGIAACHFPDQTCVDIDQHCCLNQGGTSKPGEFCEGVEACCLPNDTCEEIDALVCLQKGGDSKGPGSVCMGIAACHFPDQTCVDIDQHCCLNQGGTPKAGEVCGGVEACCLPDDACEEIDALVCVQKDGLPQGTGSVCEQLQACCLGNACEDLEPDCCLKNGGGPQGTGTACSPPEPCCLPDHTCEAMDPLCCTKQGGRMVTACPCGACCLKDTGGQCVDDAVEEECPHADLKFFPGRGCDEIICEEILIPTVSEWGLIVMMLVLMTGARVYFGNRRQRGRAGR